MVPALLETKAELLLGVDGRDRQKESQDVRKGSGALSPLYHRLRRFHESQYPKEKTVGLRASFSSDRPTVDLLKLLCQIYMMWNIDTRRAATKSLMVGYHNMIYSFEDLN